MSFVRTDYTLNPNILQQSFYDAIKARFALMSGLTLYSEYTSSTDKICIYEVITDSSKLAGKAYYQCRLTTALGLYQRLYATWNSATNTGTLPSTESTVVTFASNVAIDFVTFAKIPEYRFLAISQGSTFALMGPIKMETRDPSWSVDSYSDLLISNNDFAAASQFKTWLGCTSNPYSNTSAFTTNMADSRMSSQNPVTNKRCSQAGMVFYSGTQGIAGQTSNEIITVSALGQTRFEPIIFIADVEEYTLINPGYGAMALRRI